MTEEQLEQLFKADNQWYFFDKEYFSYMEIEEAISGVFLEYLDKDFSLFLVRMLNIDGVDIGKVLHKIENGTGA